MKNVVILVSGLLIALAIIFHENVRNLFSSSEDPLIEEVTIVDYTVDQAIELWKVEKEDYELSQIYYTLPEQTVREILTNIGQYATMHEVVAEYSAKKEYYISKYVSDALQSIELTGPDVKDIKALRIQTEMDVVEKTTTVPILPDTLK